MLHFLVEPATPAMYGIFNIAKVVVFIAAAILCWYWYKEVAKEK